MGQRHICTHIYISQWCTQGRRGKIQKSSSSYRETSWLDRACRLLRRSDGGGILLVFARRTKSKSEQKEKDVKGKEEKERKDGKKKEGERRREIKKERKRERRVF